MKYTSLYLKYLVITIVALAAVVAFITGVFCLIIGLLGATLERNPGFLVFIPAGLFCGFIGFVALDCITYLMDRWKITKE